MTIDGLTPARIFQPESIQELSEHLSKERESVVAVGALTQQDFGNPLKRFHCALDLTKLNQVNEYVPADLTIHIQAGVRLGDLQRLLEENHQFLPIDPWNGPSATIGGIAATNAQGPYRATGTIRDWIIGMTVVEASGRVSKAGGRVVKNVTGYDLSRLYSGSYGTLAAITEVSLKLVATDERTRTMRLAGSRSDLERIALELRGALPLEAIVLATGERPALYVRAAGLASAVDRVSAEVARRGRFDDVAEADWAALFARLTREPFVARLAVPPGREAALVDGDGVAYVGAGAAFLFGERAAAEIAAIRASAEGLGGALIVERAPADLKRAVGVWGNARATHPAVAIALKERFDPHGVLAPGRFPA